MKITLSDILNAFIVLGVLSAVICTHDAAVTNAPDSLALHRGDMQPGTYYAGDVVARYAAQPEPQPVTEASHSFMGFWKHIGADLASAHTSGRIAP